MGSRKGYYVFQNPYQDGVLQFPGVLNKIENQISILQSMYEMEKVVLEPGKSNIGKRFLPGSHLYNWDQVQGNIINPSFVYIRKPAMDAGFLSFLKNIKKENASTRVLLELPTFPYDKEQFASVINYPLFVKEYICRKRIHKYINRVITYSTDQEIFGIPTISISNGIDPSKYPLVSGEKKDDTIRMIAVATLQPYHGYERIILGMQEYYKNGGKREVELHIVGDGLAEEELKRLVNVAGLENRVFFYGRKSGEELTKIYNQADVGMGSFGFYKIDLDRASSLKTREYLVRGLPVVSGCRQDIFEEKECDFHLEFDNCSEPIKIEKVIEFYDFLHMQGNKEILAKEIRKYAEENVTMKKAFDPVIQYLKYSAIDI